MCLTSAGVKSLHTQRFSDSPFSSSLNSNRSESSHKFICEGPATGGRHRLLPYCFDLPFIDCFEFDHFPFPALPSFASVLLLGADSAVTFYLCIFYLFFLFLASVSLVFILFGFRWTYKPYCCSIILTLRLLFLKQLC